MRKPGICPDCGRVFARRSNMLLHQRTTHSDHGKPFECELCHKRFTRQGTVRTHFQRIHDDNQKYNKHECDECGQLFAFAYDLQQHRLTHADQKPFACRVCTRRFNYKSNLKNHVLRVHNLDGWNRQCNICGKKFPTKCSLDRHKVTHDTKRKFCCSMCGKTLCRKRRLQLHMKIFHGENSQTDESQTDEKSNTAKERNHNCDICASKFAKKSGLKRHKFERHGWSKPFGCDQCGYKTARKGDVKRHIRLCHDKQRSRECDLCGIRFCTKREMIEHRLTHPTVAAQRSESQKQPENRKATDELERLNRLQRRNQRNLEVDAVAASSTNDNGGEFQEKRSTETYDSAGEQGCARRKEHRSELKRLAGCRVCEVVFLQKSSSFKRRVLQAGNRSFACSTFVISDV